jgi:hypothetical protein
MNNPMTAFDRSAVIGQPLASKPYVVDITGLSPEQLPYLFGRVAGPSSHAVFREAMHELVRANTRLPLLRVRDRDGRSYYSIEGNMVRIPAMWPDANTRSAVAMRILRSAPGVGAAVDWNQAGKAIMRELTRKRGPDKTGVNYASQALADSSNQMTADRAIAILQKDPCGVQSKLFEVEMPLYRAIACFAAGFAALNADQQIDIMAKLNGATFLDCIALGAKYGSTLTAQGCPSATMSDPAYGSLEALKLASWNPYNASAGERWTPGYVPGGEAPPLPGGRPPGNPPTSGASASADCVNGDANACAWIAYCKATNAQGQGCSGFYCEIDEENPGCAKPPPPTGMGQPNWGCSPWPDCEAQEANWPSSAPHLCEPHPECLSKRENWPDAWQQAYAPPCQPYPGCLDNFLPPALPPGPGPGPEPGKEEAKQPWYKSPYAIAGGAALGLFTVGLVAVAVSK